MRSFGLWNLCCGFRIPELITGFQIPAFGIQQAKTSRILVYGRVKLPVLKKWTLQLYVISSVENLFFFVIFLRYLPKESFVDYN